ncbi:dynein axonemal intermediate chain 7-like isoform X3 [Pieris napi]|uniref:dynein axonemal intermediate chain 7-like isoform X3 n=1 Tax=Pieris napi TaxID=78633 RepID=UPI001FBBBCCC|nr:dynein axonemal intermediate chain 7-like isoform X3 [Pieris napi]
MGKKDKKKGEPPPQDVEVQEELVLTTDLEPEPEEVQYTDTSYTSASFESLPPVVEEIKPKKKKGKKKAEEVVEVVRKTSSEQFQWSEESLVGEEQQKVEEEEVETKKKKGKKGKKGKEVEEIPAFEKPKNWKSMNKKEREVWLQQRIEEWRAEKEAEKQAILAGAKEKRLALARERAELMAKDNAEQEIRRDILAKTCTLFHKFDKQKIDYARNKQLEAEWQQYLRCDGLPDPRVVTQMNTYIHLWQKAACDDNELEIRCRDALPMLAMLEEIVANSRQYTALQAQSYNEVRIALREQLSQAIQCASYSLLRDLEHCLVWDSIQLATYGREFNGLMLNIWVAIPLPTRKRKPVEPEPEPVELTFPAMRVGVKLPKIIDGSNVCVRAARSMVDLLSESSRSFALAAEMPNRYEDLFIFNVKEHIETYKIKKDQDVIRTAFYKEIKEKITEVEKFLKANPYTKNEKEKEELDNLNMAEPPFLPDPRTYIGEQNEVRFAKYLKTCMTRTRTGEINLRKYRICNGVLNLDLLTTPPQPKQMRGGIILTALQLPKQLQPMKYQVQYRAPSPPAPGVTRTPEEIEAELKKIEAEYEKLALVFFELPQDIMWTEPPVICQWQEQRKLWTSNYVNDYKFNEDKLTIQFRTGVLWPIGIATLRYGNLPYQGWDLKPDPNGKGVIITVTGVCITVTWICIGNTVKLHWIANATTSALKQHFNKPYSVKKMVQIMREAACDFFPDFDGHNHLEGSCPKEWVAERHNYHAMAFLSRAYNFQWSRWNQAAGSRNIIMQLREAVDKKREGKFQLLHSTPQKAVILKCNELSSEFDTDPAMGMQFYPDLFTLNMSYGSVDARRTTFNMKYRLVETVFDMLQELKLSSYS